MNLPPSSPPPLPRERLAKLIRSMEAVRDELLNVSFLLRDYLDETDLSARAQARTLAAALIDRSKSGRLPSRPR